MNRNVHHYKERSLKIINWLQKNKTKQRSLKKKYQYLLMRDALSVHSKAGCTKKLFSRPVISNLHSISLARCPKPVEDCGEKG